MSVLKLMRSFYIKTGSLHAFTVLVSVLWVFINARSDSSSLRVAMVKAVAVARFQAFSRRDGVVAVAQD